MKRSIRYVLSEHESACLAKACADERLHAANSEDQQAVVNACQAIVQSVEHEASGLVAVIRSLRELRTSPGLVVLEGLPTVEDSRRLIILLGSVLGNLLKYPNEGDYVIAIKEKQTKPGERPSFQNAREFYFHTDLSYTENPPRYLMMHAVVNKPGEGGISLFADIDRVAKNLSPLDINELQKPQFLFPAPPHYKGGGTVKLPILTQDELSGVWRLRFRRDNLRAETRPGVDAVVQLVRAINECAEEVMLVSGSMVMLDNQSFLHGRTAFAGSGEATHEPRHLNRAYASC